MTQWPYEVLQHQRFTLCQERWNLMVRKLRPLKQWIGLQWRSEVVRCCWTGGDILSLDFPNQVKFTEECEKAWRSRWILSGPYFHRLFVPQIQSWMCKNCKRIQNNLAWLSAPKLITQGRNVALCSWQEQWNMISTMDNLYSFICKRRDDI